MTLRAPDVEGEGGGKALFKLRADRPVSRAFHTRDIGNRVSPRLWVLVNRHAGGN